MLKKHCTKTDIKNTTQEHFLEKLFALYKRKCETKKKQKAHDAVIDQLPSDITSLVWRINNMLVC